MRLFDGFRGFSPRKKMNHKRDIIALNHKSRLLIEEHKDRLEQRIIDELEDYYRVYNAASESDNTKLFLMVLNDEVDYFSIGLRNSVTEYAIAMRIARLYDDMMPKSNDISDDASRYKHTIIRYSDIASMHPNYRAMGGKLNQNKFYGLIEKVHEELS